MSRRVVQQPISFLFDYRVALAAEQLKFGAVNDGDMASAIFNDSQLLQLSRRFRDAFTTDAEHVCNQFLSHCQLASLKTIKRK